MGKKNYWKVNLRVLHLSTHDSGGAAKAALRFHKNLIDAGAQSIVAVLFKETNDPLVIQIKQPLINRLKKKIGSLLSGRQKSLQARAEYNFHNENERESYFPTRALLRQLPFVPNVIVAHWTSRFINAKNLYQLQRITGAQVFWYFLDAAPFTGGCHYFWNCNKFLTHCGSCPALNSTHFVDLAHKNFAYKMRFLRKTTFTPIAATNQYLELIDNSPLFVSQPKAYIPLGIDSQLFNLVSIQKKIELRKRLGVSEDAFVILVASANIGDKRKGFVFSINALSELKKMLGQESSSRVFVLIAGNIQEQVVDNLEFSFKTLGYLNDDRELASAYQVSNLFLCTTLEDAGPMMACEAQLCGLPVVGFKVGILPDIVTTDKAGFLAEAGDVTSLATAMGKFINQQASEAMEVNSANRRLAMTLFDPRLQVTRFLNYLGSAPNRQV